MRKNTSITNKKGFSLIELCIALGVLVILTSSITPVFIKRIQIKAGEKTALEMSTIEQAALAYYVTNNAWPASIVALQTAGYLNPSWSAINPWQNAYTISTTNSAFTVSTTVPQEWTSLVARDLPTSSIAGLVVGSTVPAPGSENNTLSIGSIIIWSGTVASIPTGWQLCDGTNGTPDLRDKFVVGARQDSGGTAMTTVSGGLTKTGGEAKHTMTIAEMPPHSHSYRWWAYWYFSGSSELAAKGSFDDNRQTSTVGGGQPFNVLPPYYALCFIMKIS
ncbi:MAG: prepilin-type N-terminal cleavage/methylation domain-containing protein [Candidatus Omnitrophota bacterium]|jgi:prepilin-type N-terminal cleavage/methylation domain-containing protein|nr:MAG: prepilin-type N-terminal cleavage/methylation domain-containing protein [Candidatus Omnitrophota bacterium]